MKITIRTMKVKVCWSRLIFQIGGFGCQALLEGNICIAYIKAVHLAWWGSCVCCLFCLFEPLVIQFKSSAIKNQKLLNYNFECYFLLLPMNFFLILEGYSTAAAAKVYHFICLFLRLG